MHRHRVEHGIVLCPSIRSSVRGRARTVHGVIADENCVDVFGFGLLASFSLPRSTIRRISALMYCKKISAFFAIATPPAGNRRERGLEKNEGQASRP